MIFVGDIHAEFNELISSLKKHDIRDMSVIQVGDFGIGFDLPKKELRRLKFLNEFLESKNIKLYAIRGNHDDPTYFNGEFNFDKFSNIMLVPDYTLITIDDNNILFVGGAISIDRYANPKVTHNWKSWGGRKEGKNYWKDEGFIFDEDKIKSFRDVDIVVTHTSPGFLPPLLKIGAEIWFESDPSLENELDKERRELSDMHYLLRQKNNFKYWFYGHYHFSNLEIIEDIRYKLLDINEVYELR
jgi:DNA repair exonuclease SbcCD nuclease subunit